MIKPGLYLVTANHPNGFEAASDIVEAALQSGVAMVQYRNKHSSRDTRHTEALHLLWLCQRHRVPLLINDDVALTKQINADGVHLGQSDMSLQSARDQLGDEKIIGITCHNSIELALTAQRDGADYVAFGRFFMSQTKPEATTAKIDLLSQAHKTLDIPIVAIGGVTAKNAGELIKRGADLVAVSGDVFTSNDPATRVQQYTNLFTQF